MSKQPAKADRDPVERFAALMKKISLKRPLEPDRREPIEELIFSFLLHDSTTRKAELALSRVTDLGEDINELRTFEVDHLAAAIGRTYPGAEERALRIKSSLGEVFLREHAMVLDSAIALSKREGRKYFDTLEGMHPFVAARMTLLVLQGHAIPLDDRTAGLLAGEGVVEEDALLTESIATMERMVRAAEALQVHLLLQRWSESKSGGRSASPRRKKTPGARTGAKR